MDLESGINFKQLCCMVLKLAFITTYKRKDKTVARSFLGTVMDGECDEMPCKCH